MKNEELIILIVIVRNKENKIISRVANAGPRDSALLEATATAWHKLCEEPGSVRVEVHPFESTASTYSGKPIVVFTPEDKKGREQKQ